MRRILYFASTFVIVFFNFTLVSHANNADSTAVNPSPIFFRYIVLIFVSLGIMYVLNIILKDVGLCIALSWLITAIFDASFQIYVFNSGGGNLFYEIIASSVPTLIPWGLAIPLFMLCANKNNMHGKKEKTRSSAIRGTFRWPDGAKYDGEHENNKRHGFGTFTWPDGSQYVGNWEKNKRCGYGILKKVDGSELKGIWKDDELVQNAYKNDD